MPHSIYVDMVTQLSDVLLVSTTVHICGVYPRVCHVLYIDVRVSDFWGHRMVKYEPFNKKRGAGGGMPLSQGSYSWFTPVTHTPPHTNRAYRVNFISAPA